MSIASDSATTTAAGSGQDGRVRPFRVDFPQQALDELKQRIRATRWPHKELVSDRSQGVQLATAQALARYWANDYGVFQDDDPASPNYQPGNTPDPSTNLLNLRATFQRANYDMALFVNNALDSRPTILRRNNGGSSAVIATTFRPRTVGLSASWHF